MSAAGRESKKEVAKKAPRSILKVVNRVVISLACRDAAILMEDAPADLDSVLEAAAAFNRNAEVPDPSAIADGEFGSDGGVEPVEIKIPPGCGPGAPDKITVKLLKEKYDYDIRRGYNNGGVFRLANGELVELRGAAEGIIYSDGRPWATLMIIQESKPGQIQRLALYTRLAELSTAVVVVQRGEIVKVVKLPADKLAAKWEQFINSPALGKRVAAIRAAAARIRDAADSSAAGIKSLAAKHKAALFRKSKTETEVIEHIAGVVESGDKQNITALFVALYQKLR